MVRVMFKICPMHFDGRLNSRAFEALYRVWNSIPLQCQVKGKRLNEAGRQRQGEVAYRVCGGSENFLCEQKGKDKWIDWEVELGEDGGRRSCC